MLLGWWNSSLYGSAMQHTQTKFISGELSFGRGFMANSQVVRDDKIPFFPLQHILILKQKYKLNSKQRNIYFQNAFTRTLAA